MEKLELKPTYSWDELGHSHDSAHEVPTHLERLLSSSVEIRNDSLGYFWEYMFHQGSRYEATPYVVAPIFDILINPKCPDPKSLIDFLTAVAVGYEGPRLPKGVHLGDELEKYDQVRQFTFDAAITTANEYLTCQEVRKKVEHFESYLSDHYDIETRISAAFSLACFPDTFAPKRDLIATLLKSETHLTQKYNLTLCYGLLSRFTEDPFDNDIVLPLLDEGNDQAIRIAAAISMVTALESNAPAPAANTLLTALYQSWEFQPNQRGWLWWNSGDLLGYAATVLPLAVEEGDSKIVYAICEALEKVTKTTFSLQTALLELAFPGEKPAEGYLAKSMTDLQKHAAESLFRSNRWTTWMIQSHLLPGQFNFKDIPEYIQSVCPELQVPESEVIRRLGNVSSWEWEEEGI